MSLALGAVGSVAVGTGDVAVLTQVKAGVMVLFDCASAVNSRSVSPTIAERRVISSVLQVAG